MAEQTEYTYDLFISYAEADRAWVEGYLLDALTQARVRCHSEAAFALGVPRLLEFERAIQQSQRTLLVLSSAYLAEGFSQFTDLLAQSYGLETATWPVIPLILHPVELPPRLAMLTALDGTDPAEWPAVVERLCAELQRPVPGPAPKPPCPYPGMVPFSEADSDRFFGRDEEVQELLERLRLHPFVTVIGPSGSGKSSLVFAGLVPALRESGLFGPGGWLVRTLRPGETPLAALTAALDGDPSTGSGQAAANPTQAVSDLLSTHPDARRLLLVVDQFEELFTLARADVEPFQQALLRLAETPNCYVVLTVRADFYPDLMAAPLWREIQAHRAEVLPLDEDGLRQAIVRPAEDAGVFVETALVERLVADAGREPGVLPLVQETLVLLWEKVERRFLPLRAYDALVLSARDYRELGGVQLTGLQVAMARRADAALAGLMPEQQAVARRIFLRLVQFGEGRADTRRQQPVAALRVAGDEPGAFDRTLEHLTGNRLLTLSGEEGGDGRRVDIAHEALIGGWPTLQEWLAERREAEQTRRRLEAKATEWVRLGRGGGGLLDEVELLEAGRWLDSTDAADLGYGDALPALVQASRAAQEERAAQQRRVARFRLGALAAIVVLIIVALGIGLWSARRDAARKSQLAQEREVAAATAQALAEAETLARTEAEAERDRADLQTQVAQSRQVAAVARGELERGNAERALLLAIASYRIARTIEAEDTIHQALAAWRGRGVMQDHEYGVWGGAVSPDGQVVATVAGPLVYLWAIREQQTLTLRGHREVVTDMKFSSDGKCVATTSIDGTARLWDVQSGQEIWQQEQEDAFISLAFSPNGKYLAFGGNDKKITVWRVDTLARFAVLEPDGWGVPLSLEFSPDSQLLGAAYNDLVGRVWDVQSRENVVLAGHGDIVRDIAFSPDGQIVATISDDQTIRLWGPITGEQVALSDDYEGVVGLVEFSPDGHYLATASFDGTAYLWDVRRLGDKPALLHEHREKVNSFAFSPDGRHLATASWDGTARLWDVRTKTCQMEFKGHTERLWNVFFTPDGHYLITTSDDHTARLWDVRYGGEIATHDHETIVRFVGYTSNGQTILSVQDGMAHTWNPGEGTENTVPLDAVSIRAIALSPDDSILAISDENENGQTSLWNLTTGKVQAYINLPDETVIYGLAFDPGGEHLALAGQDGSVHIWDLRANKEQSVLESSQSDNYAVAFSPDGKYLATGGSDTEVRIWDWKLGEVYQNLRTQEVPVWAIAFSRDGQYFAAADHSGKVRVWDLSRNDGHVDVSLRHECPIRTIAFSSDGNLLAVGGEDGTVYLWNWQMEEAIHLRGHQRWIVSLSFSPDGRYLTTAAQDGTVRIWPVDAEITIAMGCERVSRDLSEPEWRTYVRGVEYQPVCPDAPDGGWVQTEQLPAPGPPLQADRLRPLPGEPVIYYFEAIPGTTVKPGESVVLRWDLSNTQAAFLIYDDQQDGVTAPQEIVVSPDHTITYRLVALNDVAQVEKELRITVRDQ